MEAFSTARLEVNNRATRLGLEDIQGYNPMHTARYDEYFTALNGQTQEYRGADVLQGGLTSPLLDQLNARYLIIPAKTTVGRTDLKRAERAYPVVYSDNQARVLARPGALPRAWLVHYVRQVGHGQALPLLAQRKVDPWETALLEQPAPVLARPAAAKADRADLASYEPDRIQLRTETSASGLLVLSETYYPAWKAYVDGKRLPLYVADHVLRAVAVTAGKHEVEMRYESWTLRLGLAISALAYLVLIGLCVAAVLSGRTRRSLRV